jgi:hypothetical protein
MSTALDNLTVEVFRSAVKTIGDAEIDAGSRESYAKLLVRLLDTQGQLLHGAEHAEHVSFDTLPSLSSFPDLSSLEVAARIDDRSSA